MAIETRDVGIGLGGAAGGVAVGTLIGLGIKALTEVRPKYPELTRLVSITSHRGLPAGDIICTPIFAGRHTIDGLICGEYWAYTASFPINEKKVINDWEAVVSFYVRGFETGEEVTEVNIEIGRMTGCPLTIWLVNSNTIYELTGAEVGLNPGFIAHYEPIE